MNEIDKTNLSDQTKFRLSEISKIENYSQKLIKENYAVKNLVNMILLLITQTRF